MKRILLRVAALLLTVPSLAGAQIASILPWGDGAWLTLLDRDGSYFGRVSVHGTLQRLNPLMHTDYELNVMLGRFSADEDARWAGVERGFRGAGASLSHPHLLNAVEWREQIPIATHVAFTARYVRDHSLTAQRDYVRLGTVWNNAAGSGWNAGLEFGVHFFKPSADIELVASRAWGAESGEWQLEVRGAVLDAFSNVVFNSLGVRPDEQSIHIDYARQPLAARAVLRRRGTNHRAELVAGASRRVSATVTFPATEAPPFTLNEDAAFAGVLGELDVSSSLTVSAHASTIRAGTDRDGLLASSDDLRLVETTREAGGALRFAFREPVAAELSWRSVWRPEQQRIGNGPPLDHDDRENTALAGIARVPATGWTWRLALRWYDREAGLLAPGLTATHWRHLAEGGYRFASRFDVIAGTRWNLDNTSTVLFAGGHIRVAAVW